MGMVSVEILRAEWYTKNCGNYIKILLTKAAPVFGSMCFTKMLRRRKKQKGQTT